MEPIETSTTEREARKRRRLKGAGLIAAGVVAGGALAGTLGAAASTGTSSSSTQPSAGYAAQADPGGSKPVRSDEKAVTAAQESTLKAAALKAVPGGTVYRIETDAGDGAYEAHMTKADGTRVTVKFDSNLKVIKVEDGMGTGDPAPQRASSGPAPSASTGA
jgi:uncharacterized membrane protein YkoI